MSELVLRVDVLPGFDSNCFFRGKGVKKVVKGPVLEIVMPGLYFDGGAAARCSGAKR